MQKILSLGVSAMALAALVVFSTGCTGDDDDDDAVPGGYWSLTVDSSGTGSGYAEFYESFEGETGGSFSDIPIGACIDPLDTTGAPPDPIITYEDVGTALTAVSGASTLTYAEITTPNIAYVAPGTNGTVDDATYDLSIDAEAFASIDVPSLPYPLTVSTAGGATTVGWVTMGASDAYLLGSNVAGDTYRLCHAADNGSFDFSVALLSSGFVTVIGANYSSAGHTGGDVSIVAQAGDQYDTNPLIYKYFP